MEFIINVAQPAQQAACSLIRKKQCSQHNYIVPVLVADGVMGLWTVGGQGGVVYMTTQDMLRKGKG